MASKKSSRTRYFTFIIYPESVVEGWTDIIDSFHVSWAQSPLHDKDINADGSTKKTHWHIMISFDSLKTNEQAQEIANSVGGTVVQQVHSPRALVRYFAHMDNPEKAQYNKADIISHGGLDLEDLLKTSNQTRLELLKQMLEYVVDNDVTEYEDLVIYAMYNNSEWFEVLAESGTYFVNAFIKSRRHRKERE